VYLPDFSYYHPENIPEACEILARYGSRAKVLAGGTDMLPKMKQALLSPEVLVSLKGIEGISAIEYVPGKGVVIGAGATHNDIVNAPALQQKYLSLSEAAHAMANNQIRNMGTVGGNIVNAVPSSDLPPILIALGAEVKLVGAKGERVLALEDFFTGPGKSVIAPDEILTEIVIPDQSATGSTYIKFGLRRSGALAVVGVAVAVTVQKNTIKDARIVLGAVAPVPMRAKKAEKMLMSRVVNNRLLEEAGVSAAFECRPISDIRGSEEYRRDMVKVFTRRALRKAIDQGHV
jgi:carbon-monoxide dehydrogenase medium subunit